MEKLYEIAKSVTKHNGREIKEQEISDIHRLPSETGIPGIIVRVNRRSVKHEILDNKYIRDTLINQILNKQSGFKLIIQKN